MYLAAAPQAPTPVHMMPFPHMQSHLQHGPHASLNPLLFAPPCQSSQIKIHRPDPPSALEDPHLTSAHAWTHTSRPSTLHASVAAPALIPSLAVMSALHGFYPSPLPEVAPSTASAAMMGYLVYPQQPFYRYDRLEGYTYLPWQVPSSLGR